MNTLKTLVLIALSSLPFGSMANTSESFGDTVRVDFNANWEILDAIVHLPDSAFTTWEWKQEDRILWFEEIKTNGYYIDNDPNYFNLLYLKNNVIKIGVVDGYWMASTYLCHSMETAVLTIDVVNDDFTMYLFRGRSEYTLDGPSILGDYSTKLKIDPKDKNCKNVFNEMDGPIFTCDLLPNGDIEISCAQFFTESDNKLCLKGNTLLYRFDSVEQLYFIEKIYWKDNKN